MKAASRRPLFPSYRPNTHIHAYVQTTRFMLNTCFPKESVRLVHGRQRAPTGPGPNKNPRCPVSNKLPWLATFHTCRRTVARKSCVLCATTGRRASEACAWISPTSPQARSFVDIALHTVTEIAQSCGCNRVLCYQITTWGLSCRPRYTVLPVSI